MFLVNDYVVYGSEGVCRVESIGHPDVSGLDRHKEYYTLMSVHRNGKIYTPTDSSILMRNVITEESAKELLKKIKEISSELEVPREPKLAMAYYKGIVRTYECEKLITIIKYVLEKQRRFSEQKRNIPAVDLKYLRIAEDMLYGELAFVLDIDPAEIRETVTKACEA